MNSISTNSVKGTYDWYGDKFEKKQYLFKKMRQVCERRGFSEYLTPLVEYAELYRAKSGEDVGNNELTILKTKGDKELALRPEMTPSVSRLVSSIYESTPKPIKLFSIANFYRNEKPQRGRNREFWQLNYDIFGSESGLADQEILDMVIELMLDLGATKEMFQIEINDRRLLEYLIKDNIGITDQFEEVLRVLDKWEKLDPEEFQSRLTELKISEQQINELTKLMKLESYKELKEVFGEPSIKNENYQFIVNKILSDDYKYSEYLKFSPNMIRGFDYYDGMIFEVFDRSPKNNRSLFGGGRYNGLSKIFGIDPIPAVGCAPGDVPLGLFIKEWSLQDRDVVTPPRYYLPIIDQDLIEETLTIGDKLRAESKSVFQAEKVEGVGKSLSYADKNEYDFIILFGKDEATENAYTLKNMKTGDEELVKMK